MTLPTDEGLAMIRAHGSAEHWLAVLVTTRDHKRPSVSVVNAGSCRTRAPACPSSCWSPAAAPPS